jgi:hypothetical protein
MIALYGELKIVKENEPVRSGDQFKKTLPRQEGRLHHTNVHNVL